MSISYGSQVLANRGRMQKQTGLNFRGTANQYDQDQNQSSMAKDPMAGAQRGPVRAPPMRPSSGPQQVADQPFNRYQAPPALRRPTGTGGTGGHGPGQQTGGGHGPDYVGGGPDPNNPHNPGQQPAGGGHGPSYVGWSGLGRSMAGGRPYNGMMTPSNLSFGASMQQGGHNGQMGGQVLGGQAPAGAQQGGQQAVPNPVGPQTYTPSIRDSRSGGLLGGMLGASGAGQQAPGASGTDPMSQLIASMLGVVGGPLNAASNTMTENDMARIKEFFGDSWGAYEDMINAGRNLMDPAQRQAAEDAAREQMTFGVNQQKDEAMRRLSARAGRGGAMSEGAQTGVNNAAMQAIAEGNRGLTQDAFGRLLGATQVGTGAMGQGGSLLENLGNSGYTSNKELLTLLLAGGERALDQAGNANNFLYGMSPWGMASGTGAFNPMMYMGAGG